MNEYSGKGSLKVGKGRSLKIGLAKKDNPPIS